MRPYTDKEWTDNESRVIYFTPYDTWCTNDLLTMVLSSVHERDRTAKATPHGFIESSPPFAMPADLVPDLSGETLVGIKMGSTSSPGAGSEHIDTLTDERGVTGLESEWILGRDSSE